MDVADDCYGRANVHDVGLAHEDFFCLLAYFAEEGFVEELLAKELLYARVEIEGCHMSREAVPV